ncbi:hypothetical protein ACFC1D_28900 [Streptomyces vinaceus]|uniref:hypothetical protein n=1 Tax=Streptomyces vinaceus TaxID=1960 RepID=UPI0035DC5905
MHTADGRVGQDGVRDLGARRFGDRQRAFAAPIDPAACQNAHVGAYGWGGLACDKPLGQAPGNYIFGGTLDNNTWLDAVQFTV